MKNNLAKVLGLEEYNQEPNIRVEPTEDEVIQIQQDNFEKEMIDHSEATAEALEAIGNARELASVIARNDSTDKTTYELLKVAVEQLKEKTGVKTQSVSLESLDKASYKTEALQDIKDFIKRVIEAIKKAFFSMWEKVKAFFKGLFDRNKSIEKEADEIAKDAAELEKEMNKAPKNEDQAKNYSSDYFGVKKNYFEETKGGSGAPALGYTPGTANKTHVGGFKTSDKDVDYSDNEYDRMPGAKGVGEDGQSNFFSSDIVRYLGMPDGAGSGSVDRVMNKFASEVSSLTHEIFGLIKRIKVGDVGNNSVHIPNNDFKDTEIKSEKFSIGKFAYSLSIKGGLANIKLDTNIDKRNYHLPISSPTDIKNTYVPFISSISDKLQKQQSIIDQAMKAREEWISRAEKDMLEASEKPNVSQSAVKVFSEHLKETGDFLQSCISAQAQLNTFIQRTFKMILSFMRQSINNIKRRMRHLIKRDGYIRDIKEIEAGGWVNG